MEDEQPTISLPIASIGITRLDHGYLVVSTLTSRAGDEESVRRFALPPEPEYLLETLRDWLDVHGHTLQADDTPSVS